MVNSHFVPQFILRPMSVKKLNAMINMLEVRYDPDNKILRNGTKEYRYKVQQLSRKDMGFLNSLLIQDTDQFFGFADAGSWKNYGKAKAS